MRQALKRTVAVGGGALPKGGRGGSCVAALVLARGTALERMSIVDIQTDGTDATDAIIGFIGACGGRVDALMAKSVPIAGFNFIDARRVLDQCGVPSIFVLEDEPDAGAVRRALREHFEDWEARLGAIDGAGPLHRVEDGGKERLIECVGMGIVDALAFIRPLTLFGRLPEPLRIATMAARAFGCISRGG